MTRLMRIRKAASVMLLVAVLMAMTTVAATAASSKQVVRWNGKATVTTVAVVDPVVVPAVTQTFEYLPNGRIKKVVINTAQEVVVATDLAARCRGGEQADEVCAALDGSMIMSAHSSTATLRRPRTIENPVSPGLPDVLQGVLTARLNAQFQSVGAYGGLVGVAPKIRAVGLGVYGCVAGIPTSPLEYPALARPISECAEGVEGEARYLLAIGLKVLDTGRVTFTGGSGVFDGVTGSARVIVHVDTISADPAGPFGKMRIIAAKLVLP